MSDTAWLILAVVVGALAVVGWIKRELWIHRQRRDRQR